MKVTSVVLTSENTIDPVVLNFRDPSNSNPYQIKTISGLDTDEIIKRGIGTDMTNTENRFYELRMKSRTIVANIGLNPRWAIEEGYSDLRDDLYRIISSSKAGSVILNFLNGEDIVATIRGNVTKMEASHFEKLPDVTLTIECRDPFFRAPTKTIVPVLGLDRANTVIVDSLSTAPHGFNFEAKFIAHSPIGFTIQNVDVTWSFAVYFSFLINDILHVSNDSTPKSVWVERGEERFEIADRIQADSTWPLIFPGSNSFQIEVFSRWNWIEYTPTYWGV